MNNHHDLLRVETENSDIEYNELEYEHENNVLYISYKEYSASYSTIEQKIAMLLIRYVSKSEFYSALEHVIMLIMLKHSIAYSSTNKVKIYVRNYHVYYKVSIVIKGL